MQVSPVIDYKALYEEESALHRETKALYGDAIACLDQANETIALLRHENALYKKMLFGSKQERFVPSDPPEAVATWPEVENAPKDQESAGGWPGYL